MKKNRATRILRNQSIPFMEVKAGAERTYSVRRHSHDTLSFGFVEKGSSKIICQPLEFNIMENQVILIPPGTIHLCQPKNADQFIFKMLYISPEWLQTTFNLDMNSIKAGTASLTPEMRDEKNLFFDLFEKSKDRMLEETHAIFFLAQILFSVFGLTPGPEPNSPEQKDLDPVKAFLDNHFTRDIQLEDLETLTGMNKFSILRRFKKRWHLPPHAYVINKRILLAKTMLKQSHTVADTAAACGFFDQSHFVKTFKNVVGIRPSAYK
ncbi:MAG: helix-turn-helix transcriptional regulator [Desulfobacter sp.]|nr:MAG: helix-turn-helix transcriptional regulator [Desulfobacter sp.]